jgi:hypothetical protein
VKKKPLKFRVIATITYSDSRRTLRGDMSGASLESVARTIASVAEYHMANDSDKYGTAKTINLRFRPLLSTTSKAKKKA